MAFVTGKSLVLPRGTAIKGQLSIPRAELCAAKLAATTVLQVENDLSIPDHARQDTQFYSDSRVVLDWIKNSKDCFKRYMTSRLQEISNISKPSQWHYVPTDINPADIGTRPISVQYLIASKWTTGPYFLHQDNLPEFQQKIIPSAQILQPTTAVKKTY